jgi:hypothetical protein
VLFLWQQASVVSIRFGSAVTRSNGMHSGVRATRLQWRDKQLAAEVRQDESALCMSMSHNFAAK